MRVISSRAIKTDTREKLMRMVPAKSDIGNQSNYMLKGGAKKSIALSKRTP